MKDGVMPRPASYRAMRDTCWCIQQEHYSAGVSHLLWHSCDGKNSGSPLLGACPLARHRLLVSRSRRVPATGPPAPALCERRRRPQLLACPSGHSSFRAKLMLIPSAEQAAIEARVGEPERGLVIPGRSKGLKPGSTGCCANPAATRWPGRCTHRRDAGRR